MSFATFHGEQGTFFSAKFYDNSWLYILTACGRVSSSFSFFVNSLMSSMYIRWLIFSCNLLSLYPAVHFLSVWLSGIMTIMNSKGDSASPWKIPLWIFVSAKLLPPAVSCTLQVFMVFTMKFMTSSDRLRVFKEVWSTNKSLLDSSQYSRHLGTVLALLRISNPSGFFQGFLDRSKGFNNSLYRLYSSQSVYLWQDPRIYQV